LTTTTIAPLNIATSLSLGISTNINDPDGVSSAVSVTVVDASPKSIKKISSIAYSNY
jgi:hypothetical protein